MKYLNTGMIDETLRTELHEVEQNTAKAFAEAMARARVERRSISGDPTPGEKMSALNLVYYFMYDVVHAIDRYLERVNAVVAVAQKPVAVTAGKPSDEQLAELRATLAEQVARLQPPQPAVAEE